MCILIQFPNPAQRALLVTERRYRLYRALFQAQNHFVDVTSKPYEDPQQRLKDIGDARVAMADANYAWNQEVREARERVS